MLKWTIRVVNCKSITSIFDYFALSDILLFFFSVKPTLKKVSKYENKFAKLQKKAAEFNFRNQLKVVKKKEFTLEDEEKEVRFTSFFFVFSYTENLHLSTVVTNIFFYNCRKNPTGRRTKVKRLRLKHINVTYVCAIISHLFKAMATHWNKLNVQKI